MADEKKVIAKDPAGLVEVEELNELTENEEVNGASTPVITATITASIALCPTTKCSSKCK